MTALAMIVKNEERTLPACLQSVHGVFDEIIVCDTGSTDATEKIAQDYGATVVHFPWIDDFAAARNHAFQHATQPYVMWLDADDILTPDNRDKLANLTPATDAVSMLYHTQFDKAGNLVNSNRRLRIIRPEKYQWVGAVHEDLQATGPVEVLDTDIIITHTHTDDPPSDRNLRILEKVMAGDPRPVDILNYGRELEMNKRYADAIPHYETFLTVNTDPEVTLFALHKLAACYYMTGQPDKEWECTLRSLEFGEPRPEFCCRIAERHTQKNQWRAAAWWYHAALNHQSSSQWSIDAHPYRTWLPHKQLALCYWHLGEHELCIQHNLHAAEYLPDDPDIQANLALLLNMKETSSGNI